MRKDNETGLQYRKRMMDPISTSFCAAKWYNATIWLGNGDTTSCHHPPGHKIPEELLKDNPSAIHNTPHKKKMREYMLTGKRPEECVNCWKVEDMGKDSVSDRVNKTEIYKDEDVTKIPELFGSTENVNLKTLEIAFDRTCQFACSYCNPAFSTTWVKDIDKNGPYKEIYSDGRGHFIDNAPYAKVRGLEIDKDKPNPYVEAFWKWWDNGLAESLEELRVTGGEPTMSPELWKLFDWFKDNYGKSDMRFSINSNLGGRPELIDKLIKKSHHVKYFDVYTSNESMFPHCEYIRDGLNWDYWEGNVKKLIEEGHIYGLHMMMTINALCLESIVEFLDWMLEIKRTYGPRYPRFTANILRFPSFQSPLTLPFEYRKEVSDKLFEWIKKVDERDENGNFVQRYEGTKDYWTKEETHEKGHPLVGAWEIDHVRRLANYLISVETPRLFTAEKEKLENDFKTFYFQYDLRRGKKFKETFKGLGDWYDGLKTIKSIVPQRKAGTTDVVYRTEEKRNDPWSDREYRVDEETK